MKQLIITADDYGMSLAVNQAIQEGIDNGVITSTNVMMNMPYCDDVERIKTKGASIGLHWNLTCGKPVLPSDQIRSLVNNDGCFHSISEFRRLYKSDKISNMDIKKELSAQYEKYCITWGEPDYWNSHENVHLWLKTYNVFLQTAKELKIWKMRSYDRIYVPSKTGRSSLSMTWRLLEPAKKIIFAYWRGKATKMGFFAPDGKICCLDEKDLHNIEYILSHIQWGKNNNAEFTIHPATECDSSFFGKMTDNRIIEYRMVINHNIHELCKKENIKLVGFETI